MPADRLEQVSICVVLAYALDPDPPSEQHDAYRWVDPVADAGDTTIHVNTRAYFAAPTLYRAR